MREREKLNKLRPLVRCLIRIDRLLGKKVNRVLYTMVQNLGFGRLGIGIRFILLSNITKRCGWNVAVYKNVILKYPENMEFGDNVSIHPWCYLDAQGGLQIGDDVSIAHMVSVLSAEHRYSDCTVPIKDQGMEPRRTAIANNVWIGAKATLLAGVTVHEGCIVGAGAVVTKEIAPDTIAAGVPAKRIGQRG